MISRRCVSTDFRLRLERSTSIFLIWRTGDASGGLDQLLNEMPPTDYSVPTGAGLVHRLHQLISYQRFTEAH